MKYAEKDMDVVEIFVSWGTLVKGPPYIEKSPPHGEKGSHNEKKALRVEKFSFVIFQWKGERTSAYSCPHVGSPCGGSRQTKCNGNSYPVLALFNSRYSVVIVLT